MTSDYRSHETQVHISLTDGAIDGYGVLESTADGCVCVCVIDLGLVGLGRSEGLTPIQTAQQISRPAR